MTVRHGSDGPSQRQLRVGEEIRHALAWMLERGEVHDPAVLGVSVTVSEVRMTPDLRSALAFVMPLGGADPETVVAGLARAKGFLRRRVADMVRLKYVPDLTFRVDRSFEQAERIETLLRNTTADPASDLPSDQETSGPGNHG